MAAMPSETYRFLPHHFTTLRLLPDVAIIDIEVRRAPMATRMVTRAVRIAAGLAPLVRF